MKKKFLVGFTTGFCLFIFAGLANAANIPPVADANGPYTVMWGNDFTVDGTGSSDPDGDAITYLWDTDLNGAYDDYSGPTPTIVW